jgi:hypothetical protein
MSMELKSQINKAEQEKDIKTLEEIQENAEIGFEGEIAGLAKAALDRLHGKVEDAEKTPDHAVEKLGEEKVEEITAEVDKEIEGLKEKTEGEIEGVVGDIIDSVKEKKQQEFLEEMQVYIKTLSKLDQIQNIVDGDDFILDMKKLGSLEVIKSVDLLYKTINNLNEVLEHNDFVQGYRSFYTDGIQELSLVFNQLSEVVETLPLPDENMLRQRRDELVENFLLRAKKLSHWEDYR